MNISGNNKQNPRRFTFRIADLFLHKLNTNNSISGKLLVTGLSLIVYTAVMLLFGDTLQVSVNYIIIVPMVAISTSFGFTGGIIIGVIGLPLNLLMFLILGHPEFSPESKLIAEVSGIFMGVVLGYLSDYYHDIEIEIELRRAAERNLRQAVFEKDLLHHEIHHRVKNNLNIIKSIIQLQVNRSKNREFKTEAEKLMQRIYSIARVHEELFKGNKVAVPSIDEYVPQLVSDIITGINNKDIKPVFDIRLSGRQLDIAQATSLGLIINEVLTNAVKYSLSLVEKPELKVIVRGDESCSIIELINNAPAFVPRGDDSEGLGLKLIKSLAAQLDAEYDYIPVNGTMFRLVVPVKAADETEALLPE